MSKNNLPSDIEGAESTGFLHGTRQKITKFRAAMYQYKDAQGRPSMGRNRDGSPTGAPIPPTPGLVVEFSNPNDRKVKTEQFYPNGGPKDRVAAKDGSGFLAAPGGNAKHALVKGGQAYLLLQSFRPHYPDDKYAEALGDYTKFEGCVVDIVAMPVGKQSTLANAGDQKTKPMIGAVVKFPWGANPEFGVGDEDEDEAEADDEEAEEDEDEEEAPPAKAKPSNIESQAVGIIKEILGQRKYKRRGIDLETLAEQVGAVVEGTKPAGKILKMAQDEDWLAEHFDYDDEEQIVKLGADDDAD